MNTSVWVLVPAPASRLDELRGCLTSLGHPAARTVVVTTKPAPVRLADLKGLAGKVLLDPTGDINLSRWWNVGLNHIAGKAGDQPYEVLVTSSDCWGSPQGITDLAAVMRTTGAVMAGPDWHDRVPPGRPEVYGPGSARTVHLRVPGACFMLAGEAGLRADERIRWWYADDDLEMAARHAGGAVLAGDIDLHHGPDHALDEERSGWAVADRALFVQKWGMEPW